MKLSTTSKALLLILAFAVCGTANSASNYSIIKAAISLPAAYTDTDADGNDILTKAKFNTKSFINLALGNPSNTAVDKNTILAIAIQESAMAVGGSPTTGIYVLVVDISNADSPSIKKTVIVPTAATIKSEENYLPARKIYSRTGLGSGILQAVGNITGGTDSLFSTGTFKVKRKSTPTGPIDSYSMKLFVSGEFHYTDENVSPSVSRTAIVTTGVLTAKGKTLGTVSF